jgi:hypothetical protein
MDSPSHLTAGRLDALQNASGKGEICAIIHHRRTVREDTADFLHLADVLKIIAKSTISGTDFLSSLSEKMNR